MQWGADTGIELKTADERDCLSALPRLLPAVSIIHTVYLTLNSPRSLPSFTPVNVTNVTRRCCDSFPH